VGSPSAEQRVTYRGFPYYRGGNQNYSFTGVVDITLIFE